MMLVLTALVCLMASVNAVQPGPYVCDNMNSECYLDFHVDFSELPGLTAFTYNMHQNGYSKVVYDVWNGLGGSVQKHDLVIQWTPEKVHSVNFDWVIYPLDPADTLDCTQTKLWYNGSVIPAVAATRANNGEDYCYFDNNGYVVRNDLVTPGDQVYFFFNATIPYNHVLMIDEDYSRSPVAKLDSIFYLYNWLDTIIDDDVYNQYGFYYTLVADENDFTDGKYNGEFAAYMGNKQCETLDTVMSSVKIGTCQKLYSRNQPQYLGPVEYNFTMPQADYATCATSVTDTGNYLEYLFEITVPEASADISSNSDCYFFKAQTLLQKVVIKVAKQATVATVKEDATDVFVDLVGVSLSRCNPAQYVPAFAQVVMELNVTYFMNDLPTFNNSAYLDSNTNDIMTVETVSCGHAMATSELGSQSCKVILKSTVCHPVFSTEDGYCALGRRQPFHVNNMIIEYSGAPLFKTFNFDTDAELLRYPPDQCDMPHGAEFVNVTENYMAGISVANIDNINQWNQQVVNFDKEIIMRYQINSGIAQFTTHQVQIQTVEFTLRNPGDASILGHFVFNKPDKLRLHNLDWTHYYDDIYFCSYFDANEADTCRAFYHDNARKNAYVNNVLVNNEIDTYCQRGVTNTNNNDFFTFNPKNWFKDIHVPFIEIEITITTLLQTCSGQIQTRLLRETSDASNDGEKTQVHYMQNKHNFVMHNVDVVVDGDNIEVYVPPAASQSIAETPATAGESPLVWVGVGSAAAFVLVAVMSFVRRSHSAEVRYVQIHEDEKNRLYTPPREF